MLNADLLIEVGRRWIEWVETTYPGAEVVTESPIAWRNEDAQVMEGRIDARILLPTGEHILVDHKSYNIRTRSQHESTAALHPRSRAPKQPARRYGPDVVNELVRIRKQLKTDVWDCRPKTTHYEALIADTFPGGKVPSPATIARLLASVGQVEASPKKRPKSSYIPFARSTAMALWQLDAFEYTLTTGTIIPI